MTAPLSLVMVNVAFGSGAELGDSDPALIGPGRTGATLTRPVIPVLLVCESLWATDTIRKHKVTTTTRHIVLHLVSNTSLLYQNISCGSSVVGIELKLSSDPDLQVCESCREKLALRMCPRLVGCELKRKKSVRQKEKFHHSVYVVLLRGAVAKHSSILRLNPKRDPLKPCVYVGMTGIPVGERFENHKNGYKSAWVVRKYGVRLMPELYEHLNPMPFEAALQMESELAEDLRVAGYTVTGGH